VGELSLFLRGTVRAMGVTFRNFFRPATTVQYPKVSRPLPAQWRGGGFALTYDPATREENCIGCRLCEYICPSQIIAVTLRKGEPRANGKGATYAGSFLLDFQACMQCELCVQVCPTDAIVMTRALAPSTFTRDGLFFSMDRLLAEGRKLLADPGLESYATPSRLQEWTDAKRGLTPGPPTSSPVPAEEPR
jgi:NADH-quinone oxidoreductase subunit I